jgi:hypothetical protein
MSAANKAYQQLENNELALGAGNLLHAAHLRRKLLQEYTNTDANLVHAADLRRELVMRY